MAVDPKLIKKEDLARVREIEFTEMFGYSIKKLMEALGVTRKIAKQAGTVLKSYKATGTLEDGAVAEGETIPLSKYKTEAVNYKEITLKKWRKATSAEAITDRGYDQAVEMTTDEMLNETAFGMTYVENFLGLGTVILNSSVPKGKIYATAKDNIVLYYIPVNGADLGEVFNFTTDATGYIGIHEEPDYTNMTASDTVINGMVLFAERIDGVVVGSITPAVGG